MVGLPLQEGIGHLVTHAPKPPPGTCNTHTHTAVVHVPSNPDVPTSPLVTKVAHDVFCQPLQPVGNSLFLSFLVGIIPILVVLILLGIVRLPAWQAALAGLIVGFIIAVTVWTMPVDRASYSVLNGFAFAILPVMWIVWNAMWLYNVSVRTGTFDFFRRWMVHNVPPDRRILMLIVGFSFGALLEGIAGFGTPVAIASAMLIGLGFPALEAITLCLIFNTAPVAFGALGVPITTLGQVTLLPTGSLSSMVGRQLPLFALILPFYALIVLGGPRALRSAWPVALVAGVSFALTQFSVSNFIGPELPDVLASLVSLICVVAFVQVWKPQDVDQYRAEFAPVRTGAERLSPSLGARRAETDPAAISEQDVPVPGRPQVGAPPSIRESALGFMPWLIVSAVVIFWIKADVAQIGRHIYKWPGVDGHVFRTVFHGLYPDLYKFEPAGTGTAILVAVALTALGTTIFLRTRPTEYLWALVDTWKQLRWAIVTVLFILGLAYLFNYSGLAYTVGDAISKVGGIFPFFSAFLGWIACFLSGSDTSSNALFGNLQVVAARQLKLHTVLMAATNSSGAVMSKMISPQSVTTGVSTSNLVGKEGLVIRRTFKHSILLAALLGVVALFQEYVVPGIIPT